MSLEFVEQQQLLSKIYYRLIMIMMSLNLNQICQRRISLLVKFELNDKNNFVKKKNDNDEFEFKLDLLQR